MKNGKMRKRNQLLNTAFLSVDKYSKESKVWWADQAQEVCTYAPLASRNVQVLYRTHKASALCNEAVGH